MDQLSRIKQHAYIKYILPIYLIFLTLTSVPIIGTASISLFQFDLAYPWNSNFIGLKNYFDLFYDSRFINSVRVMVILMIVPVFFQMLIGTILALSLYENVRGTRWMRGAFLVPAVIPPIAVGLIWKMFLLPRVGGLAYFFNFFNIESIEWFSSQFYALLAIIIASIWVGTPFVALMTLAALETIPQSYYEAASIDGASYWNRLRYITLPTIVPVSRTVAIFRLLESLAIFPIIFVLTQGGPASATEPINFYAFRTCFDYMKLGYASSLIIVFFLLLFSLSFPLIKKAISR